MKRLIFTIILTCLVLGDLNAQSRLYPTRETSLPELKKFYSRLDNLLWREGLEHLFLVNPSFFAESACCYDPADSTLVLRVADKNIWYSTYDKDIPDKVTVKEYRCRISKEAKRKWDMLIFSAIMSSSYLATPMGFDGVTYTVYWGSFTAECWSPDEKASNCYQLVKIIESLSDAIRKKDSKRIDNLIPDMESLRLRFESLYPEDVKKDNYWIESNTPY